MFNEIPLNYEKLADIFVYMKTLWFYYYTTKLLKSINTSLPLRIDGKMKKKTFKNPIPTYLCI